MWSPRRLRRLPIELRVALGATVALIGLNAAWAANQASWKIDPGTATLCGAIIGLAIIGQQARRGFANLIKSQRNQSELDRDARLHQHAIEREREIEKRSNDRNVLLAAMWAETVTVWKQWLTPKRTPMFSHLCTRDFTRQECHPTALRSSSPQLRPLYFSQMFQISAYWEALWPQMSSRYSAAPKVNRGL